jgi:hypothetical protein
MTNLVTLSDSVVQKLRQLQASTLEVCGCIDTKKDAVYVREDAETREDWHEYIRCNPEYILFHTHPTSPDIDKNIQRRPPSAADLIVSAIHSYAEHRPLQSVVADVNGYYVYSPRSYTEIKSYYHLDELTRDEIDMVVNTGVWTQYTVARNDVVDEFLDTIFTRETQKKYLSYEAVLTDFYNKLNFDIKYVRFRDESATSSRG